MGQQIYTSGSGSWTVPAGVTSITLLLIGGGGAGAGAGSIGGGGGGGSISRTGHAVTPGASIAYTVGPGGAGTVDGGNTTFDGLTAGAGISAYLFGVGEAGGSGDYTGGNGANGGGGGGSGGRSANGNHGSGATGGAAVAEGGAGGNGGAPGTAGASPGGGGGGNNVMGWPQPAGGAGYIQIDWEDPPLGCGFADTADNSGYIEADDNYEWPLNIDSHENAFLAIDVHIFGDARVTALTFNGVPMTQQQGAKSASGNTHRIECWGLINPDVGTYPVSVTLSAAVDSVTTAALYSGVNQEFPTAWFSSASQTNSGSPDDAEVTVNTRTDGSIIHAALVTSEGSVTSGQAERNNVSGANGSAVQSDTDTPINPAAPTLMNFSSLGASAVWAIGAYAIRPVGSGRPVPIGVILGWWTQQNQRTGFITPLGIF